MFLDRYLDGFIQAQQLARAIEARITQRGLPAPSLSVRFNSDRESYADARVSRAAFGRLQVSLPRRERANHLLMAEDRLPCVVHLMACCPRTVQGITVDLSDGDQRSNAAYFFSAHEPQRHLLPDPYFFNSNGFAAERRLAVDADTPWDSRSDLLRWRGGPNGTGMLTDDPSEAFDAAVMQRVRLCLIAADLGGVDAKIVPLPGMDDNVIGKRLIGAPISEPEWIGDKYAIDVDGHSNSWSNFLVRLHFGCCVFKVESQFGFRQWYYDRISPWVHFVPVRADMRDLAENIAWAKDNQAQARDIARNGQIFARSMTLDSEMARAAKLVAEHSAA